MTSRLRDEQHVDVRVAHRAHEALRDAGHSDQRRALEVHESDLVDRGDAFDRRRWQSSPGAVLVVARPEEFDDGAAGAVEEGRRLVVVARVACEADEVLRDLGVRLRDGRALGEGFAEADCEADDDEHTLECKRRFCEACAKRAALA